MLDIQLQALLRASKDAGTPDFSTMPPPLARQAYSRAMAANAAPLSGDVLIRDRLIDGPGGPLRLRIYHPAMPDPRQGIVLYLHGGGFVLGSPEDYDNVATALSALSGSIVVQVDYRLAPEHPFPAAVDDGWAALYWVAEHARELGAAPRIALAGDCSGGNLAAVLAILARNRAGPQVVQQTLIYPQIAAKPETTESYRRFGCRYTLTTRQAWYFSELYLRGRLAPADPRLTPLAEKDLSKLAPALIVVAGYDVLRDEGMLYADRLAMAGSPVTLVEYSGMVHGFLAMTGVLEAPKQALSQVADALRRALRA